MWALKAAVIVMGVLIVAGVTTIAVVITQRVLAPPPAVAGPAVLDEPAGTRIAGVAALPERLLLQLQGGGPDRVVAVDLRTGRVATVAGLAH
jgi:hypothetical protein